LAPIMPKILYLVTEDWFFVSHFLPIAQAARDCGLQVAIATRVHEDGEWLYGKEGILVSLGDSETRGRGLSTLAANQALRQRR